MAEESLNASMSAPQGILLGVGFMAIFGWLWNLSLLFCVNDYLYVLDYESGVSSEAGGSVVAQIFYDAFKQREGSGTGGIVFLLIPLIGAFFCGISNLTYVARIMFCYARDGAVPLSHMWTVYNETTQSPLYAVWVTGLLAALIGLPMLGSTVAFNAIISLSTVALNVAYIIPNLARITWGRKRFVPGPFNLGIWAYPINAIGTVWVIFILVVFSLPTVHPVTGENLNYAGIMLLGTAIVSLLWYGTPYIGAYRWFKGPVRTFTPLETLPSLDLSTKSKQMPLMTYSKDLSAGGIGTEEGDTAYKGNKFVSPEIN
ncbi:hypothetical protein CEUSTIGMA_g3996.t1 [Chlamydomonas eustigma]|uniref:Amino acid permease/ SLC12A domain-containing protein n=1 Tax=Chlamydomonas eustigma TaxID=1157962 RepID=A0A250X1D6_9CHLO|nr:hypothetical protein CEUSTIGMA_g3996.t1 [Chlamydomonas eustigma]|eukprot:GAX76550.1 hypothetical protein CEUSTIGMA_g3996.t1 [Chlamydomonas eustigma]